MSGHEMQEMLAYYRGQGAPTDQQMIIALLREAQEADGGLLSRSTLLQIAQAYGIKASMLEAIIRRVPDLRQEDVPHRLEICGTCKAGAKVRDFVERTYGVRSGSVSKEAGFSYRVTPCMKNCKNGPSIRWDGELYGNASEELVKRLIGKQEK